jgi:hypothetical protein
MWATDVDITKPVKRSARTAYFCFTDDKRSEVLDKVGRFLVAFDPIRLRLADRKKNGAASSWKNTKERRKENHDRSTT